MSRWTCAVCASATLLLTAPAATAAPQDDPIKAHPASMQPKARSVIFTDTAKLTTRVVAVGERGTIMMTENGTDWTQAKVPVSSMLNRVEFVNDSIGWAAGHDTAILKTTDGGDTWTLQNHQPEIEQAVYDLHFFDKNNGIAVGAYDLLLRTTDGGASWEPFSSPVGQGELHHYSITPLKDGTLLIAGERGMLARSTDGGETWERVASPYFGSFFGAIPSGPTGAIVFGLRGNAYRLTNVATLPLVEEDEFGEFGQGEIPDGESILLETPSVDSLFNAIAYGKGGALIGGVNGAVLQYTPGNTTLKPIDVGVSAMVGDLAVLGDRLIVAGESGLTATARP